MYVLLVFFFFFNDTATTEIYTLSLHDALPIFSEGVASDSLKGVDATEAGRQLVASELVRCPREALGDLDRKSTRLNSSHANISYAVFCLKKKKNKPTTSTYQTFNNRY